jgi:hypothetical protein
MKRARLHARLPGSTSCARQVSLRPNFGNMLRHAVGILLLAGAALAQSPHVYRGEVSDSQCALNVHSLTRSHQEMLKSKSMGGTSNTCSVYCIEHLGGYLVLSAGNDVYRLDRADLVHGFEGRRVVIEGVLDPKLKQIHVLKIDLEEKP